MLHPLHPQAPADLADRGPDEARRGVGLAVVFGGLLLVLMPAQSNAARSGVVFTPDGDPDASARAFDAVRPYLSGEMPTTILSLSSQLPNAHEPRLLGTKGEGCGDLTLDGDLVEALASVRSATTSLEPDEAQSHLNYAEELLACGEREPTPELLTEYLSARASALWIAGDADGAEAAWAELYRVEPSWRIDAAASPKLQAAALGAKVVAERERPVAQLRACLPEGWTATVDGRPLDADGRRVPPGKRFIRVRQGSASGWGFAVDLQDKDDVAVGLPIEFLALSARGLLEDLPVVSWLAEDLDPLIQREKLDHVLVVEMRRTGDRVFRYDGQTVVLLSAPRPGQAQSRIPATGPTGRRAGGGALVGVGLGMVLAGTAAAVAATLQGTSAKQQMTTAEGFAANISEYEQAWWVQRIGTGLAAGGVVLGGVGLITIVVPAPGRVRQAEDNR